MNAWEDEGFRKAVEKTGRRRLIFAAYGLRCVFSIRFSMRSGMDLRPISCRTPSAEARSWRATRRSSG